MLSTLHIAHSGPPILFFSFFHTYKLVFCPYFVTHQGKKCAPEISSRPPILFFPFSHIQTYSVIGEPGSSIPHILLLSIFCITPGIDISSSSILQMYFTSPLLLLFDNVFSIVNSDFKNFFPQTSELFGLGFIS